MFQETLLGPKSFKETIENDFHPHFPKEKRPVFEKEMPEFAINPFTKQPFKVPDLLKFYIYDENGIAKIEGSELQI